MLAIRFNRTGKRNYASFRVILQEHTKAPGKRHVEILGSYDPHKKTTILNKDRILYWISQGAQASPVVTNLLVREGVIQGKKIAKKMPRPASKEPAVAPVVADKEVKAEQTPVLDAEEKKAEEIPVPAEAKDAAKDEKVDEVIPATVVPAESVATPTPAPVTVEEASVPVETAPKA